MLNSLEVMPAGVAVRQVEVVPSPLPSSPWGLGFSQDREVVKTLNRFVTYFILVGVYSTP